MQDRDKISASRRDRNATNLVCASVRNDSELGFSEKRAVIPWKTTFDVNNIPSN